MSSLLAMRLSEYLAAIDCSEAEFARRTDIPQRTINRICNGSVRCRIDTAHAIVRATHEHPTPSGGVVTFEELVPRESAA